jgi:hypothetical protein
MGMLRPAADFERQDRRAYLIGQIKAILEEQLWPLLREAQSEGFRAPFIVEGEMILIDTKFWHPGDPR